jgi:hypothetical protein
MNRMNRITALIALLLFAALPLLADDSKKEEEFNENKSFKNKVFEVHNRNPREIAGAIQLLGSGFKGAGMSVNTDLHTITVRDFPENIASIEEAIKRLDRAEASPDISLNVAVLIGSKSPLTGAPPIPDDLAPVVKQLQSTLRYANYGLLTATMHRTKSGAGIENSGVADPALVGIAVPQGRPIFYHYRLRQIGVGEQTVAIDGFAFSMRVPIELGKDNIQYQDVGFDTPVSIRQNEKVVIGTTTMGDKALVVVVTAKVEK